MIRILYLADGTSGLIARGSLLAGHLRARGWEADGMACGASSSPACQAAFTRSLDSPASWHELPEVVRCGRYDVVHLLSPRGSASSRLALRALPHLRTIYDAIGPELDGLGQRLAARWTDHLVTSDYACYARFSSRRLMPAGRCHLIPHPSDGAGQASYLASWDALYAEVLELPEASRPRRRRLFRAWSPWFGLAPERRRTPIATP